MNQQNAEHRQHARTHIEGMEIHISDRAGFCTGTVKDISRFGLCITDIPRKLHAQHGSFDAIVSGNGKNFRLRLDEKWKAKDGLTTVVGAGIDNVPWNWTEMVMHNEPVQGDVWDSN